MLHVNWTVYFSNKEWSSGVKSSSTFRWKFFYLNQKWRRCVVSSFPWLFTNDHKMGGWSSSKGIRLRRITRAHWHWRGRTFFIKVWRKGSGFPSNANCLRLKICRAVSPFGLTTSRLWDPVSSSNLTTSELIGHWSANLCIRVLPSSQTGLGLAPAFKNVSMVSVAT